MVSYETIRRWVIHSRPIIAADLRKRADCLLEEAGARLVDATGERLLYNTKLVRRRALLASSEALAPRLLDAFRAATGARPK